MPSATPFRVLVTGASGYLGSALIRHLNTLRPGWEVHGTYLAHRPVSPFARLHPVDLRDAASVERTFVEIAPQLVIHTAALMVGDLDALRAVNVSGTQYLAELVRAAGIRMVHLSTDVIFDGARGNYREGDSPNPINPYGQSKWEAECAVVASGAQAAIVRTSLIYGFEPLDPRTQAVLTGAMPRLFTDEMRCPIWVENLCAALLEVAESSYTGVLHVAGPQPLSRYEFGLKLVGALHGDESILIPLRAAESGLVRPLNCTLDISRASGLLRTKLLGVDEVLQTSS